MNHRNQIQYRLQFIVLHKVSKIFGIFFRRSLLFNLLFLSVLKLSSQTVFYYDAFKGGSTADGYAPAYFGFGSNTLNLNIAPGSTIRKAYLIGSRLGISPDLTVQLGGNNFTFNNTNEITSGFSSLYGSPCGIHVIDVTAFINPAINNYLLDVPNQPNSTMNRYQGFYLYVAYENLSLDSIYTAIALNQQNMDVNTSTYNIVFPDNINTGGDVGVSLFTGYACNNTGDGENVACNGSPLGTFGGPDPGSGDCGGQVGSYYYQNLGLTGLNGDNGDINVSGHDALFDAQTLVVGATNTISLTFTHNGGGSDNHIYAMIFNWGATACNSPIVNLGPDQNICNGDSVIINAPTAPGYTYLWQNGATDSSMMAYSGGTYWVEVFDSTGCSARDSINIIVNTLTLDLGNDTSICSANYILTGPAGPYTYLWHDATTAINYTVTNSVLAWLEIEDALGCVARDSIDIIVYPAFTINLGNDTAFCLGNSVILTPGVYNSYLWNTAAITGSITASNAGIYWVEVTNANDCTSRDSISIQTYFPPIFTLGSDTTICPWTDTYTILPIGAPANVTYLWNDSSTLSSLNVITNGDYYLTITDANNCTYTDAISLSIKCNDEIFIPNSFTPNEDEHNPLFKAYGTAIKSFRMQIFNRWGQLIYTLSKIQDGWDGTFGGKLAPMGTYVYKITYTTYNSSTEIEKIGQINLIR